jgi:TPR repeat protein
MASDQLDGRADLYALGGVLYEMLTGQTPFRANNTEGWMHQHLYEEPQPPSRLRPELANWQGLDALPLRLLAKNREQRPKDAAELVSLLDAVRCVSPGARRETVVERLKSIATKKLRGKDVRRVPRWLRTPLVAVMALAIFIAGLAFGLPASTISKRADILDKAHHNNLGGILRNLACTRGDWGSCDKLAYMYFEGAGVAQNYSHAAALYSRGRALLRKACDTGDAVGCHNLSNMYEEGGPFVAKDITRAAALYSREAVILSKACEAGDASACYEAGGMYDLGYLIAKDYPRAADFYSKACKAGSAEGCDKLGFMYEVGEGVAEDDSRANDLYAKACNSGDASGCTALAIRYQYGDGMRKNVPRARELWSKACSMGQEYACAEEAKLQ